MVTLSLTSEVYQLSSTERKLAINVTPPEYISPDFSSSSRKKETIGKYMYMDIFAYIYTNIHTYVHVYMHVYLSIHIIFIHVYLYIHTLIWI